jgi:hypothetical protein
MDAWKGGESASAREIDVTIRKSYAYGFYPIVDIPEERPLDEFDEEFSARRNEVGLLRLSGWSDYYQLRKIPETSPVALLLTFPLTLYSSIVEHGEVPCTVAKMLKRPLRVHIVGAEKELNFLDLFKEVAFLADHCCSLELVFIVRGDMVPASMGSVKDFQVDLMDSLKVIVTSGTYGESLDPNFDCGSGPPDMLMAFNAGLYAYESWRSVITYLERNRGVVGVFTDYNELSAVQCASLGGGKSRQTVRVNPFRQPRAMPVYSMNLPQMSNAFSYVFNAQSLE